MAELDTQHYPLCLHGLGYWHLMAVTTLTLGICATALLHLRQVADLVNTTSLCEGGMST